MSDLHISVLREIICSVKKNIACEFLFCLYLIFSSNSKALGEHRGHRAIVMNPSCAVVKTNTLSVAYILWLHCSYITLVVYS